MRLRALSSISSSSSVSVSASMLFLGFPSRLCLLITYSVPEGVLKAGVGVVWCPAGTSTEPGGSVRFSLFFVILLI
uniref:Putative secreted protein n=1 Tax=Anopheles darlingi TaxID=43151 RepID=A0A2M4DQR9_ANODA